MAEPTKKELVDDAKDIGIDHPEDLTKPQLEEQIAAHNPPELGPVIPAGQTEAQPPTAPNRR